MVVRQRPRRRIVPARRRRTKQPGERPKVTDWLQALAALLVIPALGIAIVTYRDQQEINRSQLEMAKLERQRYEQRFASRVAAWQVTQDGRELMKLQNRSPVPIKRIMFLVFEPFRTNEFRARPYWASVDAPPCSILTFRLEGRGEPVQDFGWGAGFDPGGASLWFTDPTGPWRVTGFGVERIDGDLGEVIDEWVGLAREDPDHADFRAEEVPGTRQDAGDCGEGG